MIKQFNMNNIRILQNLGYQVHVATNFEHGSTMSSEENKRLIIELHKMNVNTHQVDFSRGMGRPSSLILALKQLSVIVKNNKFRFIHCQSPIGGVCGRLVGHKFHVKILYTAHGFQFFKGSTKLSWLLIYPIEKYLARYTDRLITINHEDYELAKEKFCSKKVDFVPGIGVDLEQISKTKVDILAKRESLKIPVNATVILSVGELSDRKNHSVVLKAISQLKQKNIYYVICGLGANRDKLITLAEKLGLSDRLKLLGYRTDVIEVMKASDVFVFPSIREGLPVSLMQAMAAELPSIVSRIRGNTDLIEDRVDGYLFNPRSVDELVEKLNKFFVNKSLAQSFVKESSKKIQLFSSDVVEKRMLEIYKSF